MRRVDPIPELKRQVADELLLLTRHMTQMRAGWAMHLSQSRVSEMRRGNLTNLSLEKLIQCLSHFGNEIEIKTSRASFKVSAFRR